MNIFAEIEPVYIIGDFSVKPADKGWIIESPSVYKTGSWKAQGLPFYSRGMTYNKEFMVENSEGKWQLALGDWKGTVSEVQVNGKPAALIAFPPYSADISGSIVKGINTIDVKVIGSLKNLLGPHHNNSNPGFVSPWSWRNVKGYPSGNDYQILEYGLFEDFILYKEQ